MSDTRMRGTVACVAEAPGCPRCIAMETIAVAYHEAGHAIASYATWPQRAVERATIIPGGGWLGAVWHVESSDDWRGALADECLTDAMLTESETVMLLAGYAAESRFCDGVAEMPYEFKGTPDARDAASDALYGHSHEYWGRADDLLEQPEVWLAIVQMAVALLRLRTLSGEEVEAIVEAAGIEPDPCHEPLHCEDEFDDEAFSWEGF